MRAASFFTMAVQAFDVNPRREIRRGSPEVPTIVNSLAQPTTPTETKSIPMTSFMGA
jgi:hypothetical protein